VNVKPDAMLTLFIPLQRRTVNVFLLCLLALVTGCSSCYVPVMGGFEPFVETWVRFDENAGVRPDSVVPPPSYCGPVPETVDFYYRTKVDGVVHKLPSVAVRKNMPKEFLSNPALILYFELDKNRQPVVLFNMKLSDTTIKLIAHDETAAEKLQREKDEKLYLSIKYRDVKGVKEALAQGASVIQPWMYDPPPRGRFTATTYQDHNHDWIIFSYAIKTNNIEIIDAVTSGGAPFRDDLKETAFYQDFIKEFYSFRSDEKYVSADIARVLLKNGANPNYGRNIPFYERWSEELINQSTWYARYPELAPPPIDRIIYTAVLKNDPDLVKVLLEYGAETHYRLTSSRTPPDWWKEGEWFMDWVDRTATPEVKAVFANAKGKSILKPERYGAIPYESGG
jgi:hypothetical protein